MVSGHLARRDGFFAGVPARKADRVFRVYLPPGAISAAPRAWDRTADQFLKKGFYIPILPIARGGKINEELLRLIRVNVRTPMKWRAISWPM